MINYNLVLFLSDPIIFESTQFLSAALCIVHYKLNEKKLHLLNNMHIVSTLKFDLSFIKKSNLSKTRIRRQHAMNSILQGPLGIPFSSFMGTGERRLA